MTLIDIPGPTANSFADVAFADEYIATHDTQSRWPGFTDVVKEGLLQRATELLDPLNWTGSKAAISNSLRWPRAYVYDRDGVMLDSATIPLFLRRATSELAFHLSESDTTREAAFKRIEIGPLKLEAGDQSLADQAPIPVHIRRMINFYLEPSGPTLVRG